MYKSKWNILQKIKPMMSGEELKEAMKIFVDYDEEIRDESQAVRLMELNNIYSFYIPSDMSIEIYTKLYLAMIRSMQKKESKLAVKQRNINDIKGGIDSGASINGIIGGSDSFSILGSSGIGKSSAIARAIDMFEGEKVIELENPYCKIIPVINVQCPFDCSAKSMLLAIVKKIDDKIGTTYYEMMIKSRATTNTMIVSASKILLNHVALLIIDEIQNLIKHKAGIQLVSMLTQLLNESGISICFVGTHEVEPFFESVDYLARRTLGLIYNRCEYNDYFREFCTMLWKYQYVKNKTDISDTIIHWLYEHSAGTLSHVVFLIHTAQEISILDCRDILDLESLESAYQKMRMLHTHIQPNIILKKTGKKKKINISDTVISTSAKKDNDNKISDVFIEEHSANRDIEQEWSFVELAEKSKKEQTDIIKLLEGKVSITEILV